MKNNFRKVIFLGIFALALTSCSQDGDNNPKEPTKQVEEVKDKGEKEDPKKVEAEEKKKEELANEEEKEDNKESSKENIEEPTPPEDKDDKDSDGSYLDLDGQYSSSLMANKEGEVDQMGHGTCYEYYVDKDTNTLTVRGSLSYNETIDDINAYENADSIPKGDYIFKLDENTELRSTGGLNADKPYTVDEFNEMYDKVKDSGLGLVIVVENGVVKTVSIAS